jgi:putative nucleotidyltransferase with HDIG domain
MIAKMGDTIPISEFLTPRGEGNAERLTPDFIAARDDEPLPVAYPEPLVRKMQASEDRQGKTPVLRPSAGHGFLSFKRIRTKATLYVLLLLTATVVISYAITIQILNDHIREEIVKRAESLSRSIASSAGYNLILDDLLALDNMVFKIKESNPDIRSIAILEPDRTIVVHSGAGRAGSKLGPAAGRVVVRPADGTRIREAASPGDASFAVESRIVFMKKDLGSVLLDVDWSVLSAAQSDARRKVVAVFAAILVMGLASSIVVSSRLARPVKELASGVEELKRGNRSRPLRVYSEDELGRLTSSFNEMTELITGQREKLGQYARELEEAYISTVRVLGAAIEARDHYTLGHSTRVSEYAVELARGLGLGADKVEEIEIACLFHDVGKIKIPDAILHKKGRLDPREFKEMRRHPEYGAEILSKARTLYKYIPAVRHHHEWYDGTGYPDGLSRESIPEEAAIISLADAYDAMTSNRPYREALTKERALGIIRESAGKQFNPEFARVFLELNEKQGPTVAVAAEQRLAS